MQKYIFPILITLLTLGGLGYFMYQDLVSVHTSTTASSTPTGTGVLMTDENGNQYIVEQEEVPEIAQIPPPTLNPTLNLPENISLDTRQEMTAKYNEIVTTLRGDQQALGSWLLYGTYRVQVQDYKGAEEAWIYVSKLAPSNYVAYANLGALYDMYLKDYPKAEAQFLKLVGVKPDYIAGYRSLHDLYHYRYQTETTKAVDILLRGLKSNPKNTDLLVPLALYYKEQGKTADVRKYFLEARVEAEKLGKTTLVQQIDAELSSL